MEILPFCLNTDTRNRAAVAKGKTEVRAAFLLEFLLAAFRRDALHQRRRVVRLQHLGLQGPQMPVDAQDRRPAHGDVNIGCPLR